MPHTRQDTNGPASYLDHHPKTIRPSETQRPPLRKGPLCSKAGMDAPSVPWPRPTRSSSFRMGFPRRRNSHESHSDHIIGSPWVSIGGTRRDYHPRLTLAQPVGARLRAATDRSANPPGKAPSHHLAGIRHSSRPFQRGAARLVAALSRDVTRWFGKCRDPDQHRPRILVSRHRIGTMCRGGIAKPDAKRWPAGWRYSKP